MKTKNEIFEEHVNKFNADFIPLNDKINEKTIGSNILNFNDLFFDEKKLKKKRKKLKKTNEINDVLLKKQKIEENVDNNTNIEIEFNKQNNNINDKQTYRQSCSKLILLIINYYYLIF